MLYNDTRPLTLDEVVGQDATVKALKKHFKEKKIPRVILLTGITGIGKTTLQRIIGKAILCNNTDANGYGCNTCDICKAIDTEQMNNFFFEKNASDLGIDGVRELVADAGVKSFSQAKAKVFCIDELQEMNKTQAALKNLLKPLEKDTKNVYFILGTMSAKDIPQAIKNRALTFNLKPISVEKVSEHLYNTCEKMGIKIDTEEKANVLITIADNAFGSLRTAISNLEVVIASELWTVKEVISELNLVLVSDMIKSINSLFSGKSSAFDIEYSEDIIKKLRYTLGTMFKIKSGIEVPGWQAKQLTGINTSITVNQIEFALNHLFELNKYPYLTQDLIDFTLLKILSDNRTVEQPVVRRRGE